MNASDLIALIEKLPPPEREKVRAHLSQSESAAETGAVRRMATDKAVKIAEGVFDGHQLLFHKLSQ